MGEYKVVEKDGEKHLVEEGIFGNTDHGKLRETLTGYETIEFGESYTMEKNWDGSFDVTTDRGREGTFEKTWRGDYEFNERSNQPTDSEPSEQESEARGSSQGFGSSQGSYTAHFSRKNNEQIISTGMKWALFWTILTETASLLRLKKLEKTLSGILSEAYSAEGYMLRAAEYAEKAGEIENAIQYYILYAIRIRGYEQNMGHIGKLAKEHGLENKVIEYYKREGLFKEAARYAEIFINNLQEASELYRTASGLIQDSDSYEAKDLMEKSKELEAELKKTAR